MPALPVSTTIQIWTAWPLPDNIWQQNPNCRLLFSNCRLVWGHCPIWCIQFWPGFGIPARSFLTMRLTIDNVKQGSQGFWTYSQFLVCKICLCVFFSKKLTKEMQQNPMVSWIGSIRTYWWSFKFFYDNEMSA